MRTDEMLKVEELRTEIERLRKENSYLIHTDEDIKAQNAEIERLQEHVDTLQELRELDRVLIAQLRAALEPKP